MSYKVVASTLFIKNTKKYIKQQKASPEEIEDAINILKENPNTSSLKTHKLKGKLLGSYACSVNYSIRIVFSYQNIDEENIIFTRNFRYTR
jgi:mRNA-degrading endonuclease YafQ of YafQ-DinJ toxin-antitoxin module